MKKYLLLIIISTSILGCTVQKDLPANRTWAVDLPKHSFNSTRMDSLFNLLDINNKYMGSIRISYKGKNLYARAIGFEEVRTKQIATVNTKYWIGSISKMFTSAMIFKSIEDGKLKMDQTLDSFFPTIPNSQSITIGNLLNHRSGIYNFTQDKDYLNWHTSAISQAKMIDLIAQTVSSNLTQKPNIAILIMSY